MVKKKQKIYTDAQGRKYVKIKGKKVYVKKVLKPKKKKLVPKKKQSKQPKIKNIAKAIINQQIGVPTNIQAPQRLGYEQEVALHNARVANQQASANRNVGNVGNNNNRQPPLPPVPPANNNVQPRQPFAGIRGNPPNSNRPQGPPATEIRKGPSNIRTLSDLGEPKASPAHAVVVTTGKPTHKKPQGLALATRVEQTKKKPEASNLSYLPRDDIEIYKKAKTDMKHALEKIVSPKKLPKQMPPPPPAHVLASLPHIPGETAPPLTIQSVQLHPANTAVTIPATVTLTPPSAGPSTVLPSPPKEIYQHNPPAGPDNPPAGEDLPPATKEPAKGTIDDEILNLSNDDVYKLLSDPSVKHLHGPFFQKYGEITDQAIFPIKSKLTKGAILASLKPDGTLIPKAERSKAKTGLSQKEKDEADKRLKKFKEKWKQDDQKRKEKIKTQLDHLVDDKRANLLISYAQSGREKPVIDNFLKQKGKGKVNSDEGLWSDDIERVMKKYRNFLGVIASDEIPTLLPHIHKNTKIGWITNLDPSTKPGSHWVAIVVNGTNNSPDAQSIMYFDPFGDDIPSRIQHDLKKVADKISPDTMMKLKVNRIQHQKNSATSCGYHSMNFIIDILSRHKSFAEASGFSDKTKDESGKYEPEIQRMIQKGFGYINLYGRGDEEQKEEQKVEEEKKDEEKKDEEEKKDDSIIGKAKEAVKKVVEYSKRFVNFLKGPRVGAPPDVKKFLENHANLPIQAITVCRDPVQSKVQSFINVLTAGKYEEAKKKLNYDDMYHLFMFVKTSKGSFRIEKNEVVKVSKGGTGKKCMSVPLKKELTIESFIDNAIKRMGEAKFYAYSAKDNNCQDFIMNLLSANGLSNAELSKFVKQDAIAVFKQLPSYSEKLADLLTNLGARVDRLKQGGGCGCEK
jgi:hypothetical protein